MDAADMCGLLWLLAHRKNNGTQAHEDNFPVNHSQWLLASEPQSHTAKLAVL